MKEIKCPKGCGECCKVVTLTNQNIMNASSWAIKHLERITKKEATELRPILAKIHWKGVQYFKCDLFDSKNNICKDYINRPYMCKYFPFYEKIILDARRLTHVPDCYFINQLMKFN